MSEGKLNPAIAVPRDRLEMFCQQHGIRWLAIYGSALRADFRDDSDVDVLVEFDPAHIPTLFDLSAMEQELSQLFGGRKVDLRTPADLSRYFRDKVLAEAVVQYARG